MAEYSWFDNHIGFPIANAANWLVEDIPGWASKSALVEYALTESRRDLDEAVSKESIERNIVLPVANYANSLIENKPDAMRFAVAWQNFWDESLKESDRLTNEYTNTAATYAFNYAVKPAAQIAFGLLAIALSPFNCIQRYDDFKGASEEEMNFLGQDIWDDGASADRQGGVDSNIIDDNGKTKTDSDLQTEKDKGPNQPPVLSPIYNQEIEIGKYLNLNLTAQDPNNDDLTYYAENLPTWAILNPETGKFIWKPTNNQEGDYHVTFCVSDGEYEDCTTIMIKVLPGFDLDAEIISVPSSGGPVNGDSRQPALSYDGRYIVYYSNASNLIQGDTNSFNDIYLYDRQTKTTELITRGVSGQASNGDSYEPSISNDGQMIAFHSFATNLAWPKTSNNGIYLYNRNDGKTELIADNSSLGQISANGRYVVFSSENANIVVGDSNNTNDVFVYDRVSKTYQLASVTSDGIQGNYGSGLANIGYDNSVIVFSSSASNFFSGDTNDACPNVFFKNMLSGSIEQVDTPWNGQTPSYLCYGGSESQDVSDDGRFVLMVSGYKNLVPNYEGGGCFVRDRQLGVTELVSLDEENKQVGCSHISNDGRFVVLSYGYWKSLFLRDRLNGKTVQFSNKEDSATDPTFSGDGKWLAFTKTYEYQGAWHQMVMIVGMETLFDLYLK